MNNPTTKKKRLKFAGFKPSAMQRIAQTMGYTGDMSGFDAYLNSNPDKQSKMEEYRQAATKLANGGYVQNFNNGGMPSGAPAATKYENDYSTQAKVDKFKADREPGGVNYTSSSDQAADNAVAAANAAAGLGYNFSNPAAVSGINTTGALGTLANQIAAANIKIALANSDAKTGTSSSVPFSMDGTYDPSARYAYCTRYR